MRLFQTHDVDAAEPDTAINLVWLYEVSEDEGKSWRLETEREAPNPNVLRRGNWFAPPLN